MIRIIVVPGDDAVGAAYEFLFAVAFANSFFGADAALGDFGGRVGLVGGLDFLDEFFVGHFLGGFGDAVVEEVGAVLVELVGGGGDFLYEFVDGGVGVNDLFEFLDALVEGGGATVLDAEGGGDGGGVDACGEVVFVGFGSVFPGLEELVELVRGWFLVSLPGWNGHDIKLRLVVGIVVNGDGFQVVVNFRM